MIESLFYLPERTEPAMWVKIFLVGIGAWILCRVFMLVLLNTVYRRTGNPRDLDVALSKFWSILWSLLVVQIYCLVEVNWNLGEMGRESMTNIAFYLHFVPELLVSSVMLVILLSLRREIKAALKF